MGDSRDAGLRGDFDRIGEREERIGGHDRAFRFFARALGGDADTIHPIGLTAPDADRGFALRVALRENDRVGFDVLARFPREFQRGPFGIGGLAFRNNFPFPSVEGSPMSMSCFNKPRLIERNS